MEKESFERSSAKIEHNPSIKKYTEFHEKEIKQSKKDNFRIIGFIFNFVLLIVISNYIFKNNSKYLLDLEVFGNIKNEFVLKSVKFLFILVFTATLCSALYFAMMVIRMVIIKRHPERMFIPNMIRKFSMRISFILALSFVGFYFLQIICFKDEIVETVTKSDPSVITADGIQNPAQKASKGSSDDLMYSIFIIILKIFLAFILRDIITYTLNFNVHYKYYDKRIEKNTEKISILRSMNDVINAGYTGDIDVISERFFEVLTMGKPAQNDGSPTTITMNDLKKFFGESIALKIFEYCNREGEITEEEIKGFYVSTLVEQASIVKSIEQHNSTVENFKNILNIFVSIFILFSFFEMIPAEKSDKDKTEKLITPTFLLSIVFSTSYTFSDSIKSFANNFCFVFLIRPYEVGDIIYFGDLLYKVKEINLMSTVLFDGSKYTIVPNQKISGDSIKNLRINRVLDVEYRCGFPLQNFEEKSKELIDRINDYIKKKSSEFHKNPFYKGSPVTSNGMVEVTLVVKFNCDVADIEILNERKTKFFCVLMNLLKQQ